ncbi:cupin domain-containing protein [Gordonia sp. TBRC 11910]|uniref:Cupin domain-containing protein n=1 Tax=Gordonia asplenii TaxID=2725283 RepID=A0A848KY61_9ACTN|nr:cupin domain-containing protein [Gordonia asplenii]NMO03057.1 cupin domain-containing protein [Gordonia asplenii]
MEHLLDTISDLPAEPVDPAQVVTGSPTTGFRALAAVAGAEVGVWEITPGVMTDVEVDEVFVILSGSATVTFDDGEVLELRPGVAARLREGDHTTWTVHETLRKVYVS